MKLSIRRLREMLAAAERKQAAQRAKHHADVAAGYCCSANHYGCQFQGPHSHNEDADVVVQHAVRS